MRRRLAGGLAACALLSGAPGAVAMTQVAKQDLLLAALIYNFTRFSEVEPDALEAPHVITLCVQEVVQSAAALTTLTGKPVGSLSIEVELDPADDYRGCDIVLLDPAEAGMATALSEQGVLTVGMADSFIDEGGALGVVDAAGRLRFEVNLAAVERTAFRPSSKLLRLANRVAR
ncbi:YfiR family protein [Parvularcula dongshanensis]|uniref:YfiR family protein n=1 Tax=Parvularcula dongshanensis TaxID=1173995 RepID=A0A840I629_9PROT|nr:YfiR family protein [Parvularcula dongshanensis]MBB4659470.1 hypothetical protein [Parvularcula dongshanensis]